jgi:hypothetical protein
MLYTYSHRPSQPRNNEFNCSNALSLSPEAAMPPVSEVQSVAMSPTASALLALLSTCPIPVAISTGNSLRRSEGRPHSLIVMSFAYRMLFRNDFSSIFCSPLLQSIVTIFYSADERTKTKTKKDNNSINVNRASFDAIRERESILAGAIRCGVCMMDASQN